MMLAPTGRGGELRERADIPTVTEGGSGGGEEGGGGCCDVHE